MHGRRFGNAPVLRPGRKRKVKTFRANESGKEYITGLYLENDFFGYLALITGNVRNESAMALEDSEVALLPKQEFQQQLASDTTLSFLFISFVMNSLNEAEQRLLKLAYNSARSRVVEALLFLFRKYKAREGDTIPLSRENISTLAGISPESVSRNLGELRNEGLIEILHGAVKLCNLYKLEHLRAC
ncbi:MAG TPA: Crp/Fnr family transcriptional regulator [Bacteroidia bacterium]|nr:Crp/Fnr family transcriptional regulator [Bacteroidia bacterium]